MAQTYFQRGLQEDRGRNYKIHLALGNVYHKQEKYNEAEQTFLQAKHENPSNPLIYTYLGLTYKNLGKADRALKMFQRSKELNPNNMHTAYHQAIILSEIGKQDEAMMILKDLERKCPNEPQVHIEIGKIYKKKGDKQSAS